MATGTSRGHQVERAAKKAHCLPATNHNHCFISFCVFVIRSGGEAPCDLRHGDNCTTEPFLAAMRAPFRVCPPAAHIPRCLFSFFSPLRGLAVGVCAQKPLKGRSTFCVCMRAPASLRPEGKKGDTKSPVKREQRRGARPLLGFCFSKNQINKRTDCVHVLARPRAPPLLLLCLGSLGREPIWRGGGDNYDFRPRKSRRCPFFFLNRHTAPFFRCRRCVKGTAALDFSRHCFCVPLLEEPFFDLAAFCRWGRL
jgi:hypothetical protein